MSESIRDERGNFRIGAVARLTGVSVHTLRKWEERYGAVEPGRTEGGERIYTRLDLERLRLIKRLADTGLALREIARLPLERLAQTWQQVAQAPGARPAEPVRAAILGSPLAAVAARGSATSALLDVVASAGSADELEQLLDAPIDVLIVECPTLSRETPAEIRALLERMPARTALVVYAFAARGDLLALQAPDVATVRAPADLSTLEQAVIGLVQPGGRQVGAGIEAAAGSAAPSRADADVPPPRLSRDVVARVARTSPRMRCECPHHLADIILSLRAFEEYSAECESRSPEDAQLHHYLWRCSAQARALFEDAIERVAQAEGISLEK